jgi:hypothetical protein
MTSRTIRDQGRFREITISCDHMSCSVVVNDAQIGEGGGLKTMGWQVAHMDGKLRHYCPEHGRES